MGAGTTRGYRRELGHSKRTGSRLAFYFPRLLPDWLFDRMDLNQMRLRKQGIGLFRCPQPVQRGGFSAVCTVAIPT